MLTNRVVISEGDNYRDWVLMCPRCWHTWTETTRSLYNVVALFCPNCRSPLAVSDEDFHGDDNSRQVV